MIIGMHGRLQAGKDTAMQRLAYLLAPNPVVHVSYARKLKESVAALLGITLAEIEEWKTNPKVRVTLWDTSETPDMGPYAEFNFREFLQRYGTESHRDVFGEDFWLDQALPLDKNYTDAMYVVTDARFPNELARVKELGGVTVRIDGPLEFTGQHRSETQHECDFVIDNTVRNDDFRELDYQLRELLAKIEDSQCKTYTTAQIRAAVTNVKPREGMHPMDIRYRFASQRPREG